MRRAPDAGAETRVCNEAMRPRVIGALCLLAAALPATAWGVPVPDPVIGTWKVASTGTDTFPTVFGSVTVAGGPDDFVGTTQEQTFLMGDRVCALAAGKRVWTMRRVGLDGGSATRIRYQGTSVQPYGDRSIGCPEQPFDAWWVVSLTDGRMSFSMPLWNRAHGLLRVDTTAPARGGPAGQRHPGRAGSLVFAAAEDSGWASFSVRVLSGSRVLLSRTYDHVFSTSTGETQTLSWTPPSGTTGPLQLCVTGTDGIGNRSVESCAPITVRGADAARPDVRTQPASGRPGKRVRLRWWLADESGPLGVTVTVRIPGGRTLAKRTYTGLSAEPPADPHWVWWTVPRRALPRYTFCVTALNAAGLTDTDCDRVSVRRG